MRRNAKRLLGDLLHVRTQCILYKQNNGLSFSLSSAQPCTSVRCSESSLCFLHALVSEDQNPGSFQASWDFHSEKTLGALIDRLKKRLPVSGEITDSLEKGLK